MSTSVEFLKFTASDAYKADPSILNETAELVAQAPGAIQIHSGPDAQDPQYGWVVIVWESLEHRLATAANKEIFTKIMEALNKASTKIEYMHDVAFSVDLSSALASPVTEIVSVELKPTTDIQEFQKYRAALEDKIRELSPPVWHGGAWGTVANNDRQFGACFGWDSPEAFHAFIAATPEILATIGQLGALADADLCLARLTKYERK